LRIPDRVRTGAPRRLTIAVSPTDRVATLAEHFDPAILDATILHSDPGSIFRKMLHEKAYDVAEMSLGSYTIERSRGNRDFVALPVFTSKMFRHSAFYVRSDRAAVEIAALKGCRVGVPEYQMTAAIWMRSIMKSQYGVDPRSIRWRTGGLHVPTAGERIALRVPHGYEIEPIAAGSTLEDGLLDGSLDAVITSRVPGPFSDGSGRIRRLFPDPYAEELAYYQQTGVFPIMHLLVARADALRGDPAIALHIVEAFTRSKDDALRKLVDLDYLSTSLVWLSHHYKSERQIFGDDPFAYGVAPNAHAINAFIDACSEQGLLQAPVSVDDLFEPMPAGP
jgi:4,5-dihydroxyphthalate decarboxylase